MSDKQSMSQWSQGISGVSGGIGAYSAGRAQMEGGEAEQTAYEYNAEAILDQMKQEEQASQAKYSALSGRERSLYAKAGVSLTSGSPLLILMHTAMQGEKEASRIHAAGTTKAKLLQYYGSLAAIRGKTEGISTWLTGVSKMSDSFKTA